MLVRRTPRVLGALTSHSVNPTTAFRSSHAKMSARGVFVTSGAASKLPRRLLQLQNITGGVEELWQELKQDSSGEVNYFMQEYEGQSPRAHFREMDRLREERKKTKDPIQLFEIGLRLLALRKILSNPLNHWIDYFRNYPREQNLNQINVLNKQRKETTDPKALWYIDLHLLALREVLSPGLHSVLLFTSGVIATQVVEEAQAEGLETVLVSTKLVENTPAALMADQVLYIEEKDFANIEAYWDVVNAYRENKPLGTVYCVHPGYGNLSELPISPLTCAREKVLFIGPQARFIQEMGSKENYRRNVRKAGGKTIPGYDGIPSDAETLIKHMMPGKQYVLKPVDGGGGNIIIVKNPDDVRRVRGGIKSEVIMEEYLPRKKHTERQYLADKYGNVVRIGGDRECSAQRRHAKELHIGRSVKVARAENPNFDQECEQAIKLIKQTPGAEGWLTEELLDGYALEMNTRIQVEHPVTELTSGINFKKTQFQVVRAMSVDQIADERLKEMKVDPAEYANLNAQQKFDLISDKTNVDYAAEVRINLVDLQIHDDKVSGYGVRAKITRVSFSEGADVSSAILEGTTVDSNLRAPTGALLRASGPKLKPVMQKLQADLRQVKIEGAPTNIENLDVLLDVAQNKSFNELNTGIFPDEVDPIYIQRQEKKKALTGNVISIESTPRLAMRASEGDN